MTIISLPHTARRNQIAQVMNNLAIAGFGISPTLNLDFTDASMDLAGRGITFTRASSATRVNASGLIELVGNDVARRDYDPLGLYNRGLLIEESRTNLTNYSDLSSNRSLTGATQDATPIVVPTGATSTTSKLSETAVTNTHATNNNTPATVTASTPCVLSIYAKAAERNFLILQINDGASANAAWCSFNLTTGAVVQSPTMLVGTFTNMITSSVNAGNGWWRCSFSVTLNTTANVVGYPSISSDGTSRSYAGTAGYGIYLFGEQVEAGTFATSYIPTTSATVTRAADRALMVGTNFTNWWNNTEGTFVISWDQQIPEGTGKYPRVISVWNVDYQNEISIQGNAGSQMSWLSVVANVTQFALSSPVMSNGVPIKVAAAYKLNNSNAAFNGVLGTLDTSCTLPSVNTPFSIGSPVAGGDTINGHVQRLTYYNTRLSDTILPTL